MKKQNQINFNYNEFLTQQLQDQDYEYLKMLTDGQNAEAIAVKMFAEYYGCSVNDPRVLNRVNLQKAYIEQYHADFEALKKNKKEWIRNELTDRVNMVESAKERCEFYRSVFITLESYEILNSGAEDAEQKAIDYVEAQLACEFTEEEAEKNEQALIDAIVSKYLKTDFLTKEISDLLTAIEDVTSDKELYCVAFEYGRESAGLKLILSSQACINAKKGMYNDINKYTNEKDITYAICAGVDAEAVAADVSKGAVNVTFMEDVMEVLAVLCGVCISISVSKFLMSTITPIIVSLLGFCPPLAIVAAVILGIGVTMFVYESLGERATEDLREMFCPFGRVIDKGISKLLTSIRDTFDNRKKAKAGIAEIDRDIPRVFLNTTPKKSKKLPAEQRPDKDRDYDFLNIEYSAEDEKEDDEEDVEEDREEDREDS